jgi:DNA helicase-2/ATP-dependent DNA helicase PcrA
MELTKEQKDMLDAAGHLLITGGPGAGKTTIAILKAGRIAADLLRPGQRVLFLSFARATVGRVIEAKEEEDELPAEAKKRIEVDTYHAHFWKVIKTHGYLLGLPRRLTLLTPPNESIALAGIRWGYERDSKLSDEERKRKASEEDAERMRLAKEEGRVCFGLFALFVFELLSRSDKLRKLVATRYPFIILDEFQDTNAGQWDVVRMMGLNSTLIVLADPEQRIFDFIGADPERLDHFRKAFAPKEIPLGDANHRSKGTDIAAFGNDVLTGKFRAEPYQGVQLFTFQAGDNVAFSALVGQTLQARERLIKAKRRAWSIAVLVPTKALTRHVSEIFQNPLGTMPAIPHSAAVDMEGAILAAEAVSFLMQPKEDGHFEEFVKLVCGFYRGRGGDDPGVTSLRMADGITTACDKYLEALAAKKAPRKTSVIVKMREVYDQVRALSFTGDPDEDWKAVRSVLEHGACPKLKEIGGEARNIRLLDRGTVLRQALSLDWRTNGNYRNARDITQTAFVREHFASAHKPELGVVVMNMHKAKGKQFDEVIIFERGPRMAKGQIVANIDRIVRNNAWSDDLGQARQAFRVSITRARFRTTILTPKNDPCVLLT